MDDRGTLLDDDATAEDVYSKLQDEEIRTLLLAPGKQSDPIECEMEVITNPKRSQYEALSYVWGDASNMKTIKCNGFDFKVTESLYTALLRLRYKDSWRRLWVDQLSINQTQSAELMSQLSLMGEIYSNAVRVIVWLGNYEHKLAQAWQLLQDTSVSSSLVRSDYLQTTPSPSPRKRPRGLRRISTSSTNSSSISLGSSSSKESLISGNSSPTRSADSRAPVSPLLKNCLAIFQHNWFNRKWTFPEIVLSKAAIICCGNVEMAWSDLTSWYFHYASKLRSSSLLYDSHGSFEYIMKVRNGLEKGQLRLSNLLMLTRQRQSMKPEDAIYALLGLIPDLAKHLRSPTENAAENGSSPFHVYLAALKYCLSNEPDLSILSAAGVYKGNSESDLPTWLPDWRQQLPLRPLVLSNEQREWDEDEEETSKKTSPLYSLETDHGERSLTVRGVRVGCICTRKNAWPPTYLVSEESVQTILRSKSSSSLSSTPTSSSFSQPINTLQFDATAFLGLSYYTHSLIKSAVRRGDNCEPVRTAAMATTGDWVVAFIGGPVLYVVRPIDEPTTLGATASSQSKIRCRFIGECAVHGLVPESLLLFLDEDPRMDFTLV